MRKMKYISLLRGINVGGKRKIKMDLLKKVYKELKLTNVETYIQSGNVIFESEKENSLIKEEIEKAIEKEFGFNVYVDVKSLKEFNNILDNVPNDFLKLESEYSKISITFLSGKIERSDFDNLKSYLKEGEIVYLENSEIFMYCPNGFHKSKFTSKLIESKLNAQSTARNLKTVFKLKEMLIK